MGETRDTNEDERNTDKIVIVDPHGKSSTGT
jgi:hypothetical protein